MMKNYAFWVNGAVIMGVAAMFAVGYGNAGPGIDTITTASVVDLSRANRFMVVDHARNHTCIVALHRAEGYDVHRVEPGLCDDMPREVASARTWQDTERDHVRITDRHGDVLMRLAADDRFGWNVVEPKSLNLTFEAF